MKFFSKILILICIGLFFIACGSDQGAIKEAVTKLNVNAAIPPDYQAGLPVHVAKVSGRTETPVGSGASKQDIYGRYPELKNYSSELALVDRVIETDVKTLELYQGGTLLIVLKQNGDGFDVLHSRNNFKAEHVAFDGGSDDRLQFPTALSFHLKSCEENQLPNCQLINIRLNLSENLSEPPAKPHGV